MAKRARLEVHSVSKTFGSARVLSDVDLTVEAGEVHGLAGQNGSGKSTLIKILTGLHTPDRGASYAVDGREMRVPVRWHEVHRAGVSVVHQDLGLLDQLTVAENVCVGGFPTSRLGRIDRRRRDSTTAETLGRLGVHLEPTAIVGGLSAGERAEVAIARAMRDLQVGSGLIILDESTRALGGDDLARIHALLRRIADNGSSALLISHNLGELMTITDKITILRDGRLAGGGLTTADLNEQEIARRMLGSAVDVLEERAAKSRGAAPVIVSVEKLHGSGMAEVSFDVEGGEIVGITGLPGSGFEELPYLLGGARRAAEGRVVTALGTVDLRRAGVRGCMRAGIALVPERRDRDGLAFELSVRDNMSLPSLRRKGRPWHVGRRWQQRDAETAIGRLGIRPNEPATLIKQMSGGNQQKVLLAKWLAVRPTLLLAHEPTQAVDVGARRDILRALREAAEGSVGVVLVSSEAEDLAAICDRVLIYDENGLRESPSIVPELILEQIYGTEHAGSTA